MIPISKPLLGEEEISAVKDVLLSGWVVQGPKVKEFEEQFSKFVGSKYSTAVSSGTTALHLALLAVGVKPGNIVITVSHSFIATANCIRYCFAEPAFVDIEPETFNMSAELLERFIIDECEYQNNFLYYKKTNEIARKESPLKVLDASSVEYGKVSAILVVHQIGMPADLQQIIKIANKNNIPVIEDAACAIGSKVCFEIDNQFQSIGMPHSEIACFSFHPRKVLTTGDGGMISTNNAVYDEYFKHIRQHSMSISAASRHSTSKIVSPDFLTTGFNYRMTDIQASIGIEQLKKLPELLNKRYEIDHLYRKYLSDIDWLTLPYQPEWARSNWQSYAIRVLQNAPVSRDSIMQTLLDNGISSGYGIMNAHEYLPYSNSGFKLSESEKARKEVILLPIYQDLNEECIEKISNILRKL
ncbi:MAG: DegT/DnrJ/EryC1/StrS family aminotransferase [Cyanobacteriota bacterium]